LKNASKTLTRYECEYCDWKYKVEFKANVGHEAHRQKGQHHKLKDKAETGEKLHRYEPSYQIKLD
jgi:hypothetical protein